MKFRFAILVFGALLSCANAVAQEAPPSEPEAEDIPSETPVDPKTMTLDRLEVLIKRIDENARRTGNAFQLAVNEVPVMVVTDPTNDRMRILVPITGKSNLPAEAWERLMQANFDTALDARYAVANDMVWGTFIHPLGSLSDVEFLSGLGQSVNLLLTFGTSFSSGALSYGGGDSQDIIRRQLIDELLKRGGDPV